MSFVSFAAAMQVQHAAADKFSFIADDGKPRTASIAVVAYDAQTRTYTFPPCKDKKGAPVCYYPTCIGKCGSGCGNDKKMATCTDVDMIGNLEVGQGPMCKSRCLNHDLCEYVKKCPGSVKYTGTDAWTCMMAKASGVPVFQNTPFGMCPTNFHGYTEFWQVNFMRQKTNSTVQAESTMKNTTSVEDPSDEPTKPNIWEKPSSGISFLKKDLTVTEQIRQMKKAKNKQPA